MLRTSDWGEGSPSNRTMTPRTQPRKRRSGFGTRLEPDLTSLERPENSCAAKLPIQPDRALEDLQKGRMGETPQIQVCQTCSIIPKKTRGCNRCQMRFNKILSKGSEYLCKSDIFIFYKLENNSKNLFLLCHYVD